tara:strand:- start:213 stop:1391 length:1179 start_codon:yes stop_codon:yes gene_type:complete
MDYKKKYLKYKKKYLNIKKIFGGSRDLQVNQDFLKGYEEKDLGKVTINYNYEESVVFPFISDEKVDILKELFDIKPPYNIFVTMGEDELDLEESFETNSVADEARLMVEKVLSFEDMNKFVQNLIEGNPHIINGNSEKEKNELINKIFISDKDGREIVNLRTLALKQLPEKYEPFDRFTILFDTFEDVITYFTSLNPNTDRGFFNRHYHERDEFEVKNNDERIIIENSWNLMPRGEEVGLTILPPIIGNINITGNGADDGLYLCHNQSLTEIPPEIGGLQANTVWLHDIRRLRTLPSEIINLHTTLLTCFWVHEDFVLPANFGNNENRIERIHLDWWVCWPNNTLPENSQEHPIQQNAHVSNPLLRNFVLEDTWYQHGEQGIIEPVHLIKNQ